MDPDKTMFEPLPKKIRRSSRLEIEQLPENVVDFKNIVCSSSFPILLEWEQKLHSICSDTLSDSEKERIQTFLFCLGEIKFHYLFDMEFYLPGQKISPSLANEFALAAGEIGQGPQRQFLLRTLAEQLFYKE